MNIKKFENFVNEDVSNYLSNFENRLDNIDKENIKKEYKYYVGSVRNTKLYSMAEGTFKGFYTREDVLTYIKNLIDNEVKAIQIYSPEEFKKTFPNRFKEMFH